MTARANSLTRHATAAAARPVWTMAAADLRVLAGAFERLGFDSRALLTSAGLRVTDLDDPDARFPCDAVGAMVALAQRERFTLNLALELARVTPIGAYPLLDYLVITSDTVGGGVRQLARYFRLTSSPVVLNLHEEADPVRVEMTGPGPFALEYSAALMVVHLGNETDRRFAAESVCFQHQPDDVGLFARTLGCPVRPGSPWNGLRVAQATWRLPLRRRDPVLRQLLESQAGAVLARLPARTGLALEVQRALSRQVEAGGPGIDALSRELAMSSRTLQRRLAAEGVSYQELLEEARKDAAGRHIIESTLAIGEVAYLVGYSEPAPFHRAFKRWYGTTPEAFRRRQRTGR